jgi:hypothetical protein
MSSVFIYHLSIIVHRFQLGFVLRPVKLPLALLAFGSVLLWCLFSGAGDLD